MNYTRCISLTVLVLAAILVASGCGRSSPTESEEIRRLLTLTTSAESLEADGLSELLLIAHLLLDEPDPTKLDVQFETTGGTVLGGEVISPCLTSGAVSCVKVRADRGEGVATARLRSSTTGGPVTVTAILLAVGVQDSRTIEFLEGPMVLAFAGTPATGEADGETAIRVTVEADDRIAAGTEIKIEASSGSFLPDKEDEITRPLGSDNRVEALLQSPVVPGVTLLTATVVGMELAPARHEITFSAALPSLIVVNADSSSVAADATVDLTAEYFRNTGAGRVSEGLVPTWKADKVDDEGTILTMGVGRFLSVSPIQADPADSSRRISTATFEAAQVEAGDRVRITVTAGDGEATGSLTLVIE